MLPLTSVISRFQILVISSPSEVSQSHIAMERQMTVVQPEVEGSHRLSQSVKLFVSVRCALRWPSLTDGHHHIFEVLKIGVWIGDGNGR